jgi:ankyrin repeat protein
MDKQMVQYIELPNDVWNKIIACSSNEVKNILAELNTQLNSLSKKTNHSIYQHFPLTLSPKQQQFALRCAIYYGNSPAVENLLQQKIDPNKQPPHCQLLPLNIAQYKNHMNIISILKKYNALWSPEIPTAYEMAVCLGDVSVLKNCLKIKHCFDRNDPSLLDKAIYNGHPHIVECLLADSAFVKMIRKAHSKRNLLRTSLWLATDNGQTTIMELLFKTFPEIIDDACYNHCSFLNLAVQKKHHHSTELLLKQPHINITTYSHKYLLLHIATENNDLAMVTALLTSPDIPLNLINENQKTALDLAIKQGDKAIAVKKMLTEHGAKTSFYLHSIAPFDNFYVKENYIQ